MFKRLARDLSCTIKKFEFFAGIKFFEFKNQYFTIDFNWNLFLRPLHKICNTYPTMMKLGTVIAYLKKTLKLFWNNGCNFIICVHDVINKTLWRDSNYIVDLLRCSWFSFNNLGLAPGMALKFYTSVAKGLKLKVRKFLGVIPKFVEVTGEKLVRRAFMSPPTPWIGLRYFVCWAFHFPWFLCIVQHANEFDIIKIAI